MRLSIHIILSSPDTTRSARRRTVRKTRIHPTVGTRSSRARRTGRTTSSRSSSGGTERRSAAQFRRRRTQSSTGSSRGAGASAPSDRRASSCPFSAACKIRPRTVPADRSSGRSTMPPDRNEFRPVLFPILCCGGCCCCCLRRRRRFPTHPLRRRLAYRRTPFRLPLVGFLRREICSTGGKSARRSSRR